jgi:MscS family membrane protein
VLPIAARFGKVAVAAMLIIAVLSNFGLPVASLIAGLGVGGVALALAAQKTVENMFGAVSIGADRPLKIGDFVKVGELLGTVESIGLRSTRIRTLDRTLVTIPNGGLADSRIESYTERDRIRFTTILGLEYGTKQAVLREVIAKIERTLREHPKIWPDTVVARFAEFGPYSLNIEIMVWFLVTDFNDFRAIREGVLFDIMTIVEQEGAAFAFPTQTLHLQRAT